MAPNVTHDSVPPNSGPHSQPAGFLDHPFPVCIFVVTRMPNQNETSGLYRALIGLYDEYCYYKKFGLEQAFQPKTKLYDAMGASIFRNPESNWWQTKLLSFLNLTDQFFPQEIDAGECVIIAFQKLLLASLAIECHIFPPLLQCEHP